MFGMLCLKTTYFDIYRVVQEKKWIVSDSTSECRRVPNVVSVLVSVIHSAGWLKAQWF